MSIIDIKKNFDNLENRTKDELVKNIHELLIHEKKISKKNISLQTEVKYLNRHLKKIKGLIERILKTKTDDEFIWSDKNAKNK